MDPNTAAVKQTVPSRLSGMAGPAAASYPSQENSAKRQSGFTLIELLTVVVILAILSSFALLNMNFDNRSKQLEEMALQIAALIELASDESIYLQRELGLRFGEENYAFYQLNKSPEQKQEEKPSGQTGKKSKNKPVWETISGDPRLRQRALPEDIEVMLEISGIEIIIEDPSEEDKESGKVKPHIMMLSNGEVMPNFAITLLDESSNNAWIVASGTTVPVTVERRE